jgi:hypothetical protein
MSAQQGDFPDRATGVRLEICETRSIIAPRYWQVWGWFRWMQLKWNVNHNRRKLSEETRSALEWAEEALEREFLYGKEANGY